MASSKQLRDSVELFSGKLLFIMHLHLLPVCSALRPDYFISRLVLFIVQTPRTGIHGLRLHMCFTVYGAYPLSLQRTELTTQLTPDQKQGHASPRLHRPKAWFYHALSPHAPHTFHTVQTRLCHTHRHPHTQRKSSLHNVPKVQGNTLELRAREAKPASRQYEVSLGTTLVRAAFSM